MLDGSRHRDRRTELEAYNGHLIRLACCFNLDDARDVALGVMLAMERGRAGIRYLLGAENLHLSDWLRILGEETGQRVPRWRVPYALALSVAWFSELWADQVTGKIPMAMVTGVRLTRRSMFFDPAASLAEVGLEPRPIQESARAAVAWYRTQQWI